MRSLLAGLILAGIGLVATAGASAPVGTAPTQNPGSSRPTFSVVSVMPMPKGWNGAIGLAYSPGGVHGIGSLEYLIKLAYHVNHTRLLSGANGWMASEYFQIATTTPRPASDAELELMLQAMRPGFPDTISWRRGADRS